MINLNNSSMHYLFNKPNKQQKFVDYLYEKIDAKNRITLVKIDTAKAIGCSRPTLDKIIKEFLELKLIVHIGKAHHYNVYMVSPAHVWKGKQSLNEAACEKFASYLLKNK